MLPNKPFPFVGTGATYQDAFGDVTRQIEDFILGHDVRLPDGRSAYTVSFVPPTSYTRDVGRFDAKVIWYQAALLIGPALPDLEVTP